MTPPSVDTGRKFRAWRWVFVLVAVLAVAVVVLVAVGWLTAEEARALAPPLQALGFLLGGSYGAAAISNGVEHYSRRGTPSQSSSTPEEAPPAAPDPNQWVAPGGPS